MSGTHRTCEICGIKERHCDGKLFFARFPLDKYRCSEWLRAVGKVDLAYLLVDKLHDLRHVCQKHFSKKDFTKTKTRLKKRAVPKLELSAPPLTDEILAIFLQLNENPVVESSARNHNLITTCTSPASAAPAYEHNADPPNSQCTDIISGTPDPPEPVGLQFSWQENSLVALDDEPCTESEVLPNAESRVARNAKNDSELVKDTAASEVTDYRCDVCQNNISGYTCVQCDDYDLCGTCEAKLFHPQHYMLRVPGLRPQREVKSIIEIIKRKLKILQAELRNDGIARMDWDVEIKKEEDPFEEAASETTQHHNEDTSLGDASGQSEVPDVLNQLDNAHNKQMEQNIDCAYEQSDNSASEVDNENHEEEWLEEFLLDNSDDVDSGCDSNKKLPLQEQVNDLQFEESVRSEDKNTKVQLLPHKQTCTPVQNITGDLKSDLSEGSISLNPKKIFETTYNVLNLLKSRPNVECIVYKNHEYTNRPTSISDTQLTRSSNEVLKHTCKRNANDYLDEAVVDDVRDLARSSNITSNTIAKSAGMQTGIKLAGKRRKLSSLDTEKLKESTMIADSNDRQTVIPKYNANSRKSLIAKDSDDHHTNRQTVVSIDNVNSRKTLVVGLDDRHTVIPMENVKSRKGLFVRYR